MPLLKLLNPNSTQVLRVMLHLSPAKKRLFRQKLAARSAAEATFARKAIHRHLYQPGGGNPVGVGPVPQGRAALRKETLAQLFISKPVGPDVALRKGRLLELSGRRKGFQPGHLIKQYAYPGNIAMRKGLEYFKPKGMFNRSARAQMAQGIKLQRQTGRPWLNFVKKGVHPPAKLPSIKVSVKHGIKSHKRIKSMGELKSAFTGQQYARFTRTQQAALSGSHGLRPGKTRHTITRKSTLPPSWASNYMSLLYFISGKYKKDPEVKKTISLLKGMSRDLYIENRGEAFIPRPGEHGFYPIYSNIPYQHIQTAIRKNTSKRVRWASWLRVAATGRPYKPKPTHSSLTRTQEQHFLAHAAIGLPHKKGRYPHLLGQAVPGQLLGKSGSVIDIKNIDPGDWAKGGFTPMKFALSKWWSGKRKARKHFLGAKHGPSRAKVLTRDIMSDIGRDFNQSTWGARKRTKFGPPEMSVKAAKSMAEKLSPKGTKVKVKSGGMPHYMPATKELQTSRRKATIHHEATHARQRKFLGSRFDSATQIAESIGGVGVLVHGIKAGRRTGEERKKHLKKAMKWGILGAAPRLGLESHANLSSLRLGKTARRHAFRSQSTHTMTGVATAAVGTLQGLGIGHVSSGGKKLRQMRSTGPPQHPINKKGEYARQLRYAFSPRLLGLGHTIRSLPLRTKKRIGIGAGIGVLALGNYVRRHWMPEIRRTSKDVKLLQQDLKLPVKGAIRPGIIWSALGELGEGASGKSIHIASKRTLRGARKSARKDPSAGFMVPASMVREGMYLNTPKLIAHELAHQLPKGRKLVLKAEKHMQESDFKDLAGFTQMIHKGIHISHGPEFNVEKRRVLAMIKKKKLFDKETYARLWKGRQIAIMGPDWATAKAKTKIRVMKNATHGHQIHSTIARGMLHDSGVKISRGDWAKELKAARKSEGPRYGPYSKVKVPDPRLKQSAMHQATLEAKSRATRRYNIPQDLTACYENGIREGLSKKWRAAKWKMKQITRPIIRWTRMKLLPAATEGAIKGTITTLHQQTGMLPPTTIDLKPVRINALSSAYRDIPDDALKAIIAGLRARYIQETNLDLRKAIQRKVADVQVELTGRRLVPMSRLQ